MKEETNIQNRIKKTVRVGNKMKVDNKQKQQKMIRFFIELKEQPSIRPFLNIAEIPKMGVRDFVYITPKPPTLQKIQKKLARHSYKYLCSFINDLTKIFKAVSDYCLSGDSIQTVCDEFIDKIHDFQDQFNKQFQYQPTTNSTNSSSKVSLYVTSDAQSQSVQDSNKQHSAVRRQVRQQDGMSRKTCSLLHKLKMVGLVQQQVCNQVVLRKWASANEIYDETESEIILTISDKQGSWQQLINRRHD